MIDYQSLVEQLVRREIAPSSMAYNNRGQAYLELGELSNAQNDFLEAIAIDSSNVIAIAAAASCFAQRKDFSRAIDYYDKAIMIDPNQSSLLISKAIALYEVERWGDAYETVLAAKQLSPDDKTIERYLSSIEEHFEI